MPPNKDMNIPDLLSREYSILRIADYGVISTRLHDTEPTHISGSNTEPCGPFRHEVAKFLSWIAMDPDGAINDELNNDITRLEAQGMIYRDVRGFWHASDEGSQRQRELHRNVYSRPTPPIEV